MRGAVLGLIVVFCGVRGQLPEAEPNLLAARRFAPFPELLTPNCENPGPFPYVVSVRGVDGGHRCGGTLVSSTAVLTAASCADPFAGLLKVAAEPELYLGGAGRDDPVERRFPCNVVFSPDWMGYQQSGPDLALIIFSEPSCLPPVPLIGTDTRRDMRFLIGFGKTGEGEPFAERKTISSGMFVIEPGTCTADYGVDLIEGEKCTRSADCDCSGGCDGDQGAPFISVESFSEFSDQLEGIVSRLTGLCGASESVTVYTELEGMKWWIDETLSTVGCRV